MLQTIVHIFFQNVGVFKFKFKKNIHKCRRGRKLHKCELSTCLLIGVLLRLKYSFSGSLCSSKYFSNKTLCERLFGRGRTMGMIL